jgi:hypothetical protein
VQHVPAAARKRGNDPIGVQVRRRSLQAVNAPEDDFHTRELGDEAEVSGSEPEAV